MFFLVAEYLYGPPSIPISILFGPPMTHHFTIINPFLPFSLLFLLFRHNSLRLHPRRIAAVAAAAMGGLPLYLTSISQGDLPGCTRGFPPSSWRASQMSQPPPPPLRVLEGAQEDVSRPLLTWFRPTWWVLV